VYLTVSEIEKLVYSKDKLSKDEVESLSAHLETCELCQYLVNNEQLLHIELKRGYKVGTHPPLILNLLSKNYKKPARNKKIILAADSAVTASNGFYNIGSFVSSEYGIIVRFVEDKLNAVVNISALSANEEASLSFIILNLKSIKKVILLDKNAKATVPMELFTDFNKNEPIELEVIFPVISIKNPVVDSEYSENDFKLRLNKQGTQFSISLNKVKPYMPDLKRVCIQYKGQEHKILNLSASNLYSDVNSIKWIHLYAG